MKIIAFFISLILGSGISYAQKLTANDLREQIRKSRNDPHPWGGSWHAAGDTESFFKQDTVILADNFSYYFRA